MKPSARYAKIVEWSEEDQCFIGSAPGLFRGGCHGDDERAVFAELCEIVDEWIAIFEADGKPLPPSTFGSTDRLHGWYDEPPQDNSGKQAAE